MGKRSTIYMGKTLEEHTDQLQKGDSVSGRINRTVERYLEICRQHGLELNEAEAEFLIDFLGEGWASSMQLRYLPQEIRQRTTNLWTTRSGNLVDVYRLADRIEQGSFADLLAVIERMGK